MTVSSSRFRIEEVGADIARAVWYRSPHATVFTNPDVASRLATSVYWFAAIKGSEVFVVWPVALNSEGEVGLPPFSYYFGPFWSDVAVGRAVTSTMTDRLDAYEGLISTLLHRFGSVRAELHPQLLDVRAFSWWNYHDTDKPKFVVEPRYTAQVGALQESSAEEIFSNLRELRRREIRRVERNGVPMLRASVTPPELTSLYRMTFERQGASSPTGSADAIERLCSLVDEGVGHLTASADRDTGELFSAVLCLAAKGSSNMVLNLTNPTDRGSGHGPWTVFQSILQAKTAGMSIYDFNGANSPQRGDDKHSYGAREVLYFSLTHIERL